MIIDSFDVLFYTAIFVLPGFIINSIIDSTNPPHKNTESVTFLKYVGFSLFSCAIWSWLYYLIIKKWGLNSTLKWVLLVLVSFIGSSIIGLILTVIKQKQIINIILQKMSLNTIHPTPTAWDYYFSQLQGSFIIVTLIDETQLYGLYSSKSFTSSDPNERDIYVETGYLFEEDKWIADKDSLGFYIPKDQIKYIEFKKEVEPHGKQ